MRSTACLLLAFVALASSAATLAATDKPTYSLRYAVRFQPDEGTAAVEITTKPQTGRLIRLDLDMPAKVYRDASGDGEVERTEDRVSWVPPRAGGTFRYEVVVDRRRRDGAYDSRMTSDWVVTRGDRLFPPARVGATRGSGSRAVLHIELPPGWEDAETPFSKIAGGDFAVTNAERRFDRPVGWIAAGRLTSTRETIAGTRVTLTAPSGTKLERVANLALLRQAREERFATAEEHRGFHQVKFVKEPGAEVLPDGLRPPPMRTSLSPAACFARSSAASIPSVTKWKVVPPAISSGLRGWWVSTKTGTW